MSNLYDEYRGIINIVLVLFAIVLVGWGLIAFNSYLSQRECIKSERMYVMQSVVQVGAIGVPTYGWKEVCQEWK